MTLAPWLLSAALAWPELGPDGVPTGAEVDVAARFAVGPAPREPIVVDDALAGVADSARRWILAGPDPAATAGALSGLGATLQDTVDALAVVVQAGNAARATGHNPLSDPDGFARHFGTVTWRPDVEAAARHKVAVTDQIRLTRYLVYEIEGRPARDDVYNTALYAAPAEDTGDRLRFTRQDVLAGVYEEGGAAAGHARPLVWVTREGLFRALMQGTARVSLPDGSQHLFNVHVHNGIPYDRDQKDPAKQARFWYFREVDGLRGYTAGDRPPIAVAPRVTVAGDVYNLGLGRLILLDVGRERWLTVLADTGGAFQPNLYQLDWLSGVFPSYEAYLEATARVPERVAAALVLPRAALERP